MEHNKQCGWIPLQYLHQSEGVFRKNVAGRLQSIGVIKLCGSEVHHLGHVAGWHWGAKERAVLGL